ncbi:Uncharacterized protein DAT39_013557, partial [Clarias magur]
MTTAKLSRSITASFTRPGEPDRVRQGNAVTGNPYVIPPSGFLAGSSGRARPRMLNHRVAQTGGAFVLFERERGGDGFINYSPLNSSVLRSAPTK